MQPEHIRKPYRSYLQQSRGAAPVRHRGKSPQQPAFFTRSARARHESALLASLCRLAGALPTPAVVATPRNPSEPAYSVAGLNRGDLLCHAYESYRSLIGAPWPIDVCHRLAISCSDFTATRVKGATPDVP
jgi:hypothetical protein